MAGETFLGHPCKEDAPETDLQAWLTPSSAPSTRLPPARGWSDWYLTDEDDVGEGAEHGVCVRLLLSALGQLAAERRWERVFVAGDQFFAWLADEPLVRISPDVYVLDDPPPRPFPRVWETWRAGQRGPRFAVEVASEDWRKDYRDNPRKYAQLGCAELVIFDPDAALHPRSQRTALQLYRRQADGTLFRVAHGAGPIYCEQIDAWIVLVEEDGVPRARLARDASGSVLVPTAEEVARRVPGLELAAFRAERRMEAAERNAALAERRAALAERNAARAEHRAELAERRAEVAERRAEVAERRAELAERRAALAESRLEATERRLEATERRLEETERRLALSEARAQQLLAERDAALAALRASEAAHAATAAELADTRARLLDTEARLSASEARAGRLEALLEHALRRIDDLEAALRRA